MIPVEQLAQARSDLAAAGTEIAAMYEHMNRLRDERDALRAEVEQLRANDANDASALDDKLAAGWLKPRENGESMRSVLDRLIEWNRSVAIDPAFSSAAAELVDRARAEERERCALLLDFLRAEVGRLHAAISVVVHEDHAATVGIVNLHILAGQHAAAQKEREALTKPCATRAERGVVKV